MTEQQSPTPARRGRPTGKVGRPAGSTREQTIARILRSALTCFTRHGFAGTTFKDIAAGAGITPAGIYQYFDSKEALYTATLDDVYQALLPRFEQVLREYSGLRQQLRGFVEAIIELHEARPEVTAFLSSVPVENYRHPALKEHFANRASKMKSIQDRLFRSAKRHGEIPPGKGNANLSLAFFGSLVGMVIYHHGSAGTSLTEGADIFLAMLEGRFFSDDAAR